jgi:hypothetical protein
LTVSVFDTQLNLELQLELSFGFFGSFEIAKMVVCDFWVYSGKPCLAVVSGGVSQAPSSHGRKRT